MFHNKKPGTVKGQGCHLICVFAFKCIFTGIPHLPGFAEVQLVNLQLYANRPNYILNVMGLCAKILGLLIAEFWRGTARSHTGVVMCAITRTVGHCCWLR